MLKFRIPVPATFRITTTTSPITDLPTPPYLPIAPAFTACIEPGPPPPPRVAAVNARPPGNEPRHRLPRGPQRPNERKSIAITKGRKRRKRRRRGRERGKGRVEGARRPGESTTRMTTKWLTPCTSGNLLQCEPKRTPLPLPHLVFPGKFFFYNYCILLNLFTGVLLSSRIAA